jgi:hypothetical protein
MSAFTLAIAAQKMHSTRLKSLTNTRQGSRFAAASEMA